MIDFYIYRYQILAAVIIITTLILIIAYIVSNLTSIRRSYRIQDNMPIISFDQTGRSILGKLRYIRNKKEFQNEYDGIIFEEHVYQDDSLGNQHIKYTKLFILDRDTLLMLNFERLLQRFDFDENQVVIYIATNLCQMKIEE